MAAYYAGMPGDAVASESSRKDVWEAHMGLFITVLVLLAICLIIIIIGLICLKCKKRDTAEKVPLTATMLD